MVVEEPECVGVAGASQLDEGDQPGALGLGLLRGRGLVGVIEVSAGRGSAARGRGRPVRDRGLAEQEVGAAGNGDLRGKEDLGNSGAQGFEPASDVVPVPLHVK